MNICFATSECVPYVKTGGLADVCGALPKALSELGHRVRVVLPLYRSIRVFDHGFERVAGLQQVPVQLYDRQVTFDTWRGHVPGSAVEVFLVDCPAYFHRSQPYTNDGDEADRFIFFQHAVFHLLQRLAWAPDVLHCNDWQTSLMPVLLRKNYGWDRLFAETASVLTLHNTGYQGRFDRSRLPLAGLSVSDFYPGGPYELHGAFCFMKPGLLYADVINTVSPTYAREIQTQEFGCDLDGVLRSRSRDLYGILNGIDTGAWNPATDTLIPFTYDADTLEHKEKNKQALLREMHLPHAPDVPVVGVVSRFVHQKGFQLLQPIMQELLHRVPVQFVVLGSGEAYLEDFFRWAHAAFPDRVAVYVGYNDRLSHLIEAGADLFLMPSAYEPCGLNQMYSLNYGTVPIVRKTGGLADTVHDYHDGDGRGNGFTFTDFTPYALYVTILRALGVFKDRNAWETIMRRGMTQDFSWTASARRYVELYEAARHRQDLSVAV